MAAALISFRYYAGFAFFAFPPSALANEQFSALTVAGWELVQTYETTKYPGGRCYLFRKAKP